MPMNNPMGYVNTDRDPKPRLMKPDVVRPSGADQYRLPAGYRDGNDDEHPKDLGNICPGC